MLGSLDRSLHIWGTQNPHINCLFLTDFLPRFPVSEVRAEAASALGTILGDSLLARKLVLSPTKCGGALDFLQTLLDSDSDDERSFAVYSLFNSFRHMSAKECKLLTDRFGGQIARFAEDDGSSDRLIRWVPKCSRRTRYWQWDECAPIVSLADSYLTVSSFLNLTSQLLTSAYFLQ